MRADRINNWETILNGGTCTEKIPLNAKNASSKSVSLLQFKLDWCVIKRNY